MKKNKNQRKPIKGEAISIKTLLVIVILVCITILALLLIHEKNGSYLISELIQLEAPTRVSAAKQTTCVIGPKRIDDVNVDIERIGKGVDNSPAFCNAGTRGCGSCIEQCGSFDKIVDLFGCPLDVPDLFCNPDFPADPDCNWILQDTGTLRTINDIEFANANSGWAARIDGRIMRSTDGGNTWSTQTLITDPLMSIDFVDASTGWVVGANGSIFDTTNGGISWSIEAKETLETLNGVTFVDSSRGWVAGNAGIILRTTTGGSSWGNQATGVIQNLNDIHFVKASTGWAVGDGNAGTNKHTVLRTTDGGITWALVGESSFPIGHDSFTAVVFLDVNRGYISSPALGVYYTDDGGLTWVNKYNLGIVNDLDFIDVNNGWLASNDNIIRTVNGGATWTTQFLGLGSQITDLDFINLFDGWAAGGSGHIFFTDNGGA